MFDKRFQCKINGWFCTFVFSSENAHVSWTNVEELIKRAMKMINDHERFLTEVRRTSGQGLQGVRREYKSLEVEILFSLSSTKKVQAPF